jgi:hypothetical protein
MFPLLGALQRDSLSEDTPGAVRVVRNSDGTYQSQIRLYNGTGGAMVAGRVYVLSYDGDEETNPKCGTPATLAIYQHVVVAINATASATWDWFAIQGYVDALVEGTTDVAKDDFLEVLNTETSFKKDGAAKTVNSPAIACAAQAADSSVLTRVYLFGERILVAAA